MINFIQNKNYKIDIKESFSSSFVDAARNGYASAKGDTSTTYEKYETMATEALRKSAVLSNKYSKILGIPQDLATALVAAGIVGGPQAVPLSALIYFAKKPILDTFRKPVHNIANKVFDKAWGAGAKVAQKIKGVDKTPETQINMENFRNWFICEEQKEGWLDYMGRKSGDFVGRMAGHTVGIASRVGNTIKNNAQDVYRFITSNPKEATRALFLIGIGAATGGIIGNMSSRVGDMVLQEIHTQIQGIPSDELAWLHQHAVKA